MIRHLVFSGLLATATAASAAQPVTTGAKVAGWRTDTTGRYPDANPPIAWSKTTNVAWSVAMPGRSSATPIIVGDKIFAPADPYLLVCLNKADGKTLWKKDNPVESVTDKASVSEGGAGGKPVKANKVVGQSCCTAVSNGEVVFAFYNNGVAALYDLAGNLKWSRFVRPVCKGYGQSMSPALGGDVIGLHIDDEFFGLDLKTGKLLWKGAETQHQGSPVALKAGNMDVFLGTDGTVFRAKDGQVLTKLGFPALAKFSTPAVVNNTAWWLGEDKFLVSCQFRPKGKDEVEAVRTQKNIPKGLYYASVLVSDGMAWFWDCANYKLQEKKIYVMDIAAGKIIHDLPMDIGGWAYPSPSAAGSYVYVSGDTGQCVVFAVKKDKSITEVARNSLEPYCASLVFEKNMLYVRGHQNFYCIENKNARK